MSKKSIFDLDPEQLKQLLSVGKGNPEPVHDEQSDSSTEEPQADPTSSLNVFMEKPGDKIGRYKLLKVLGEGGMGIVYLAEQEGQIRRKVALKVIKPGMDSKRVIARFEAERQALALLDHPNIAHVHDAGTTESGRPYFVMEYVKGLSITEHCDRHKLTIEERLNLFRQVCLAVHHAHQKGIIHRDIKPSNILVSLQDDRPVPKIIDFGVAKALAQPLTERTVATEVNQLLGTPEYMSPEQADMAIEDIDTRSDVYSLGVLLYVLLTGVLPFDAETLREGGIEHVRKVIRETDPKTPSTRLTGLGEQARELAESRGTEVVTLAKCLKRELEWIPLKAMRKERAERYRSAIEMADDVENYLKGAPLLAGPPTARYRLRKFVRRNKKMFAAVVMVAAALVIGLAASIVFLVREQHARQQAQANELKMRQIAYASDMSLAQHALSMDDVGRAQRLLNTHRPAPGEFDLRGWEWRYLWNKCRSDALGELCQYPNSAFSVAYSHDGNILAVTGDTGTFVDIWDIRQQKQIHSLQSKGCFCVAFSPRGDLLATNTGNQVRVWRTGTWDRIEDGQLTTAGYVTDLKFSPAGTRLACLGHSGKLTVWEVNQWAVVHQSFYGTRSSLPLYDDLDFSPDGEAVVIGDHESQLQVLDLVSEKTIFDVNEAHPDHMTAVAWSPNGSVIVSGSGWLGGPIRVWDAASGKSIGELEGHSSWISNLVFSKDGRLLYSSSGDQTIRIWDMEQRLCLATLHGSSDEVMGLALSPDGTTLASACKDGVVAFWNAVPKAQEEMRRVIPVDQFTGCGFAPDSQVLAVAQGGTVNLYDLTMSKEPEQIQELGTDVSTIAYSPDGTLLISGSRDGKIRVWSCVERCLVQDLENHKLSILLLRFRADGTRLLSLCRERQAIWWDTSTWQVDQTFSAPLFKWKDGLSLMDVSPDGRFLACSPPNAFLWLDAESGEIIEKRTGTHIRGLTGVCFSSDGLWFASTDIHGTVTLWDTSSLKHIPVFKGHLLGAHGPAFSPNGRRLVTCGTGRDAVRLWHVPSLRELITIPEEATFMGGRAAFSPDGNYLVACSPDKGKLHLWRAPSWEEIEAEEKKLQSKKSP